MTEYRSKLGPLKAEHFENDVRLDPLARFRYSPQFLKEMDRLKARARAARDRAKARHKRGAQ